MFNCSVQWLLWGRVLAASLFFLLILSLSNPKCNKTVQTEGRGENMREQHLCSVAVPKTACEPASRVPQARKTRQFSAQIAFFETFLGTCFAWPPCMEILCVQLRPAEEARPCRTGLATGRRNSNMGWSARAIRHSPNEHGVNMG